MRKLMLVGANNPESIRQANAIVEHGQYEIVGFLDNDPAKKGTDFFGFKVHGGFECLSEWVTHVEFVNLITRDAFTRHEVSMKMLEAGACFGQFIHPTVNLLMVDFGAGCYIQETAIVQAEVKIGWNSSVSAGAIINHESVLGRSVFVAPGANICGKVTIGDEVFVGASSVILPRIKIGSGVVIGAGAVVTCDIPDGAVVVGSPARPITRPIKKLR